MERTLPSPFHGPMGMPMKEISTRRGHLHIPLVMAALLALFAFSPSHAYAQDSIEELVTNKNADGFKRVSTTERVFAEIGMGLTGIVISAVPSLTVLGSGGSLFGAIVAVAISELIVTPITAEMVYQGGRVTGGRAERWASYAGGYVGFGLGLLTGLICLREFESLWFVPVISIPVLSLVGSIVGYELSEKSETDRLKRRRDGLVRSAPIMITLYSGSF